jgi:hypothetical protein
MDAQVRGMSRQPTGESGTLGDGGEEPQSGSARLLGALNAPGEAITDVLQSALVLDGA